MTVEGLTELFVKDSYFLSQTKDLQIFLQEAGKQNLNEMTKCCENYREAHNIHGDEQNSYEKQKHNRGVEMDKHRMQEDKPHHNETNQKQMSGKDGYSRGDTRPSTFGYSHSGGAESHYKPKSGCFVPHKSKGVFLPQNSQHKEGQAKQQHRVAACQAVEEKNVEEEWTERKVNIPGIGSVPMIAAMSNSQTDKKRQILDMRKKPHQLRRSKW